MTLQDPPAKETIDAQGYRWRQHDRTLVKGDILRVKSANPNPTVPYLYSVCSGAGFGCNTYTIGQKIYVDSESDDINYALANKNNLTPDPTKSDVWRKGWGVEYLTGWTTDKDGKVHAFTPEETT